MKRTLLVLFAAVLVGCGGGNKPQDTPKPETPKPETALTRTLDACIAANPNYNNNDIARSVLADSITVAFQTYRGKQLKQIENIPCEYEMALEYGVDPWQYIDTTIIGKYVVKFNYSDDSESNDYRASFQVFAILEKEKVMQLVEGNKYFISGTFRDFANNTTKTGFRFPSGKCLIDYPSVSYFTTLSPSLRINLGTIVLDNLTFKQVQ